MWYFVSLWLWSFLSGIYNCLACDWVSILTYMNWFLNPYNCRVASSLTITPCVIEVRYGNHIYIFDTLQCLYCVTSNKHTSCVPLNWPKLIVLVSIWIFSIIFIRCNYYIYYFPLQDKFINDCTVLSVIFLLIDLQNYTSLIIYFVFCMQI